MPHFGASLNVDSRVIIYDCNVFIEQVQVWWKCENFWEKAGTCFFQLAVKFNRASVIETFTTVIYSAA